MNAKRSTPEELLARRKDLRVRLIPEVKFEICPIGGLSGIRGRLGANSCFRVLYPAFEIEDLRQEITFHLMNGVYGDHGCALGGYS